MATIIPAPSSIAVFQGRATTNQTITTASVNTPITLAAEDFDDLNGHSTTTQTSRYVIQRAGVYSVSGSVIVIGNATATNGTQARIASILKNGAIVPGTTSWNVNFSAASSVNCPISPTLVTLALNDYIELALQSQLANVTTLGDSTNCSILRVDFVR